MGVLQAYQPIHTLLAIVGEVAVFQVVAGGVGMTSGVVVLEDR